MTTEITSEPTTEEALAVLAPLDTTQLRTEALTSFDALPEPEDLPGTLTLRQREAYAQARLQLNTEATNALTLGNDIAEARRELEGYGPVWERFRALKISLYAELDAVDKNSEAFAELLQTLDVLSFGPHHLSADGRALLPARLREALTDTCPHCGHSDVVYPFPLEVLDSRIRPALDIVAMAPERYRAIRAHIVQLTKDCRKAVR